MTVARLQEDMEFEELVSWGEFYRFEAKLQKDARKKAESEAKTKRGARGRGRRG